MGTRRLQIKDNPTRNALASNFRIYLVTRDVIAFIRDGGRLQVTRTADENDIAKSDFSRIAPLM